MAISRTVLAALAVLAALSWRPASAETRIVDEVRAGALAHDVTLGGHHVESGVDINGEVLFVSPSFLDVIWAPRPHLGFDANTDGNTDSFYFGLTWEWAPFHAIFTPGDRFFLDGSLGGAYQDGHTDNAPAGRKKLGSPVLFRESIDIGYGFTPAVSFSVFLDHISNANLANHNAGITNVGGRFGFKF
jgi:lipid A 3-O-deacylase